MAKNSMRQVLLVTCVVGWGGLVAGESSTYDFSWLDPDKEVYVLQNRKFRKKRSLFVSGGGGKTLSGAFVDSNSITGAHGIFF